MDFILSRVSALTEEEIGNIKNQADRAGHIAHLLFETGLDIGLGAPPYIYVKEPHAGRWHCYMAGDVIHAIAEQAEFPGYVVANAKVKFAAIENVQNHKDIVIVSDEIIEDTEVER